MQTEFKLFSDNVVVSDTEEWRTIERFPLYEVSTMGRFRNKRNGKLLRGTKCWTGYTHIGLMGNGKQVTSLAHRLVVETFLEPPSAAQTDVNHINKNRCDNRLSNLEWSTRSENSKHAKNK